MPKYKLGAILKKAGFVMSDDLQIDTDMFQMIVATMAADEMATNLSTGQKTSGTSAMPKGKTTKGRPRGMGTHIASTIHAKKLSDGKWKIAADEKVPGQLNRVLKGVKLKLPNMKRIFDVAIKTMLEPEALAAELL